MNMQSKWVIGGILAAVLIVGCTLGAVTVTLMQRARWGYPAYAANFTNNPMNPNNGIPQGYNMMPGAMFGGGPMMNQNYMGRGAQGFGPGSMGHGGYGPNMMDQQGFGHGNMGRDGYGPMMGQQGFGHGSMGRGGYGPGMMGQQGFGPSSGRGSYGPMMDGARNALLPTVAEELDMTTTDLLDELQSGKTVADLAQEKDVSLDKVVDTMMAPHIERMALMVANEAMSQEQVDAMLELMKVSLTTQLNSEWTSGTTGFGDCPGFDDTNGDGVCDFSGRGQGGGRGYGMMWR